MSAIQIAARRDRAIILTDSAYYLPCGEIVAFATKQFAIPHLPAVIAVRGPIMAPAIFGTTLGLRFDTFDAMKAGIEDALRDICDEHHAMFEHAGGGDIHIMLAGWSESRQVFESYSISTRSLDFTESLDGDGAEQSDAFRLLSIPPYAISPVPHSEIASLQTRWKSIEDVTEADMLEVLHLQRRIKDRLTPDEEPAHFVGGWIQQSALTRDGVQARIVHRFADRVGEKIDPTGDTNVIAMPAPMSRLRREMLEKKARKHGCR